ncbi:MAG: FAD-binding oxidoreductase [Thermodesulfobacteriota bacterium]|nr:FAD-binding oxidoreductase [Thermodesulfobacteriota bacterium]
MPLTAWGRYPEVDAHTAACRDAADVATCLHNRQPWISYGLGRSYGDSALGENVLLMSVMNRMLSFDCESGILCCEAGLSLNDILEVLLPQGWFLPVTPGTRHVTVGGAIASDVHGKNHHVDGSFSQWVYDFTLMLPDGRILRCSPQEHRDLFLATCGGMGLTGVILSATIQMRRVVSAFMDIRVIRARGLQGIFDCFERYASWPYVVAWVDCLTGGDDIGRALVLLGAHAEKGGLIYRPKRAFPVPAAWPGWMLNQWSGRLFNMFYYYMNLQKGLQSRVPVTSFFYPLDGLASWNRFYGQGGMVQYQFVLPKPVAFSGLRQVLAAIRRGNTGPFLGVLKLLGEANSNFLSFPMAGYTLALDFKAEARVFSLLDELDAVVADHGGRVYLAKDARMRPETLIAGYPLLDEFLAIREKYSLNRTLQSLQSHRLGL